METTVTFTGWVLPVIGYGENSYGLDNGGYFGPAGASLAGDAFTSTFTGDYSIGTYGTVYDANITINGHTFDFGAGGYGNNFLSRPDGAWQYQAEGQGTVLTFGSGNGPEGANGELIIALGNDGRYVTQAYLSAQSVPAPTVGEGPLALVTFVCLWLTYWSLQRPRRADDYPAR